MPSRLIRSLFTLLLMTSTGIFAATLEEGMELPHLDYKDQHGAPATITEESLILLFAPDRESSELVHPVLQALTAEGMRARGIRYIADISAMPSLISSMFALPKMRDYAYPVLLGHEPDETAMLPRQANQITLMRIRSGRIGEIHYLADSDALKAAVDLSEATSAGS